MQARLRQTVIKLQTNTIIHFSRIKKYSKFGFQAQFQDQDHTILYNVSAFSKTLLQLNAFNEHIEHSLKTYRSLNSKIVAPVHEVVHHNDMMYVVSDGYEHTLADLVRRRQGLTEYEAVYFFIDLMEIMNYLRNRDCFFEKLELDDISLNKSLKVVLSFGIFFNSLGHKSILKQVPFRFEARDPNNCPDLFLKQEAEVQAVNSWNIGVLLFIIFQNRKPFEQTELARGHKNTLKLTNSASVTVQAKDLVQKLLQRDPKVRLKFNLVIIEPLFKKYSVLPHILPETIFYCPPSQNYKLEYDQYFCEESKKKTEAASCKGELKKQTRSAMEFSGESTPNHFENGQIAQTLKQFEDSERTLSENKVYIEQFVDISHKYGYGYQMNNGTVSFVFNDQTEMYFSDSNMRSIVLINRKKEEIVYSYQKFPEQEEIKKKIFILEAYEKTLKRYKVDSGASRSIVTVKGYCKTKNAGVFHLSNDFLQVIFNDRISFLLTRNGIYLQQKKNDTFEKYEPNDNNPDMIARKDYALEMGKRIFQWELKNSKNSAA